MVYTRIGLLRTAPFFRSVSLCYYSILIRQYVFRRTASIMFSYNSKLYSINMADTIARQLEAKVDDKMENEVPPSLDIARILAQFREVVRSDNFNEIIFHPVVEDCIRILPHMKEEEYAKLISILLVIRERFTSLYQCDDNIVHISKHLDRILCDWLSRFEREEILKLLNMSKVLVGYSTFTVNVVKDIKKALKWPTPLMLQYVEHMNKMHMWNVYYVDKYNVEYAFSQHFHYLDIDQAAVVLGALDHLKIKILTPELPRKLFELFLEQYPSAKSSTLLVFVKFFSSLVHCFGDNNFNVHTLLPRIVQVISECVYSWQFDIIVYAASFFRRIRCYDPVFFEKLAERMVTDGELHYLKANVIDELVMTIVYFNGRGDYTENLKCLLKKLKIEPTYSTLRENPKRLVSIINNLSKVGIYDEYFLNLILSNGFLIETYKKLKLHYVSVNVYCLDRNVVTECLNYDGRRLDENLRRQFEKVWNSKLPELFDLSPVINKEYYKFSKKASAHDRLIYDMRTILWDILGEEYVHLCWMHPHIPRLNFIFALKDRCPQKLDEEIKRSPRLIPNRLNPEYTWCVFEFLTPNTFPPYEPLNLYNGINSTRLLTILGFNLIPFVGKHWSGMDSIEKIEHLKKLIFAKP